MTNDLLDLLRFKRLDSRNGNEEARQTLMVAAAAEIEQLRGNLSMAEEGLANAMQENERLRQALSDVLKETYADAALTQKVHGIAHAGLQHEPSVTRLPVPGTKLARLSDIADDLVKEMRRQGMETLQSVFDGVKVRVEPWREPQPWGTKREICTAEQGHSYSQYTEGRRCIFCGSPGPEVKSLPAKED